MDDVTSSGRPLALREAIAIVLMTFGSLVPILGWLAGVSLLWTSRRLSLEHKVKGTLVMPLGAGGFFYVDVVFPDRDCDRRSTLLPGTAEDPVDVCDVDLALPRPLVGGLVLAWAVPSVVVAGWLLRRAWRAPAGTAARRRGSWGLQEAAALIALTAASAIFPLLGALPPMLLVLLSRRWTTAEKALALVLVALPLCVAVALSARSPGHDPVAQLVVYAGGWALAVVAAAVLGWRLVVRERLTTAG